MSARERQLIPPTPTGEPFRADPQDPAPFQLESAVEAERAAPQFPEALSQRQQFQHPSPLPKVPLTRTPEQRFARIAIWVGVASIFVFNLFLGPVAVVLGLLAMRRGEVVSGRRAVILGALGTLIGATMMYLLAEGMLPNVDQMLKDLEKQ